MEPRLKTSKKWTPLPKDFLSQIRSVFKQSFKEQIGDGKVEADGRIYPEEILVRVGYRQGDGLKQSNWEVSLPYKKEKDNVLKLLHIAVDAAASLFEQSFANPDDQDFPRLWQEFEVEGRPVFAQYSTVNTKLEAEADRLLGLTQEGLAGGEWEDEISPDEIKAKLGIDPDEMDEEDASDESEPIPGKKH